MLRVRVRPGFIVRVRPKGSGLGFGLKVRPQF